MLFLKGRKDSNKEPKPRTLSLLGRGIFFNEAMIFQAVEKKNHIAELILSPSGILRVKDILLDVDSVQDGLHYCGLVKGEEMQLAKAVLYQVYSEIGRGSRGYDG